MIFCITQKLELYNVEVNGENYGLWDSYGHDLVLFNLISRTQMPMFNYEPGVSDAIPPQQRIVSFSNISDIRDTLSQEVEGNQVRKLLHTHDPEQMLRLFRKAQPHHLKVVGPYVDLDGLLLAMLLRVLQWKKHYRGKLHGIEVQFRSKLTIEEEVFLHDWIQTLRGETCTIPGT